MTALRTPPLTATRAPLGSSPARHYDQAAERAVAAVRLWPGITWGLDARCSCSKAFRHGVMQVKVRSSACVVHLPGRVPAPRPPAAPPPAAEPPPGRSHDDDLLAALRSGTVTRELYDAAVESWQERHGNLPPEGALRRMIAVLAEALGCVRV